MKTKMKDVIEFVNTLMPALLQMSENEKNMMDVLETLVSHDGINIDMTKEFIRNFQSLDKRIRKLERAAHRRGGKS